MNKRGISLQRVQVILVAVACVMVVIGVVSGILALANYMETSARTDAYMESVQDAASMQNGSDYLTEQVRLFVVSGNPANASRFYEEIETTRTRELALEGLREHAGESDTFRQLEAAMALSNALAEREAKAMRLAASGFGLADDALPDALRSVALSAAEAALTPTEQIDAARDLVFGVEYQRQKAEITGSVARCTQMLIGEMSARQQESSQALFAAIRGLVTLVILLAVLVIGTVFIHSQLMIRPLHRAIEHIRSGDPLPIAGAEELRYLSGVYNVMLEATRRDQEKLGYEASHDALTGLYNRSAFERLQQDARDGYALLLVDLDHFKGINDTLGHDTGDRALKKVAGALTASFRREDYICRIGGDEFAVLMVRATEKIAPLIRGKIEALNDALAVPEDGLPAMSLSVGVAFCGTETMPAATYKRADQALYRVKEAGRRGVAFDGIAEETG